MRPRISRELNHVLNACVETYLNSLVVFGRQLARSAYDSAIGNVYWHQGGVLGPAIDGNMRPRFFISGNGDGGLIDFVAAASADFDHATTIRMIVQQPGIGELTERLNAIDNEARAADTKGISYDFLTNYDARIGADVIRLGLVEEMRRRLRPGVQLTFQTRNNALMTATTSTLNVRKSFRL